MGRADENKAGDKGCFSKLLLEGKVGEARTAEEA